MNYRGGKSSKVVQPNPFNSLRTYLPTAQLSAHSVVICCQAHVSLPGPRAPLGGPQEIGEPAPAHRQWPDSREMCVDVGVKRRGGRGVKRHVCIRRIQNYC